MDTAWVDGGNSFIFVAVEASFYGQRGLQKF